MFGFSDNIPGVFAEAFIDTFTTIDDGVPLREPGPARGARGHCFSGTCLTGASAFAINNGL